MDDNDDNNNPKLQDDTLLERCIKYVSLLRSNLSVPSLSCKLPSQLFPRRQQHEERRPQEENNKQRLGPWAATLAVFVAILIALVALSASKKKTATSSEPSAAGTLPPEDAIGGGTSRDNNGSSFPTALPTATPPASAPSSSSSSSLSYIPGLLNVTLENGLLLSHGLQARILAQSEETILLHNKKKRGGTKQESLPVHRLPDFGATFVDRRLWNKGGWIYVSNSEDRSRYKGGVGAFTFNANGQVVDYRMILTDSTANCGGGATPWKTWISCEETEDGKIWQVDPTGERPAGIITLGSNDGGKFESFAYDVRRRDVPQFFVTEDERDGALRRWRPINPDWSDPWNILYGKGTTHFLILNPDSGTFMWTPTKSRAQQSARAYYPNSEGIDVVDNLLYFVSKERKRMFILNLDDNTYTSQTTRHGAFDGGPDQIHHVLGDNGDNNLLFFTEDGGLNPGIHGRDSQNRFFTLLESPVFEKDESTGLAFSPDGRHLYFAFQKNGTLYDVTRTDGQAFHARTLNIKYHATEPD